MLDYISNLAMHMIFLCVNVVTYSLERLSDMFELPVKEVHSIVSRMIIKEELLVRM